MADEARNQDAPHNPADGPAPDAPFAPLTLHAETLQGDLMKLVIDEMKAMPDIWRRLGEDAQTDVIDRVGARVQDAVSQCVKLMAARGNKAFKAHVESVTFKDGIKATLSGSAFDEQRHLLADAAGSPVVVVIADPSEFLDGGAHVQPDPQQPSMFDGDGDGTGPDNDQEGV
ncbi:hypothetical protein [Algiphilus sp.]|uniref:hypothetical protein n=1 Tax=Algiphilus sp. TaxID=1872431 RepID=UPI002A668A7F|nr:hypothetical protein [Pseudomonadota bacterium]